MPQHSPHHASRGPAWAVWRSAALRGLGFLGLWAVITEADPGAVVPGVAAAAAASWASLRLLPPTSRASWPRPLAALRLTFHFLLQSVMGSVDVAWRALSPRMKLAPGFVQCRLDHLPSGVARHAFAAEMSLLPGTLGAGIEGEVLTLHCLDASPEVVRQVAEEEVLLAAALGGEARHG